MNLRLRVRVLSVLLLAITALALAIPHAAFADNKTIHIGYQKYGTLTVAKVLGNLDKRFQADGISVDWVQFPGGPQLLEALNSGAIDFGTTGEAPPIFAQAASTEVTYVAFEPGLPFNEAILIPEGSTIKSVADLKGKKIALNKGSNVHFFLIKALEDAGLKYEDIEPLFLAPADARAAFSNGSVDAWAIWEPFLSVAKKDLKAKVLRDGTGLVANRQFYLARQTFIKENPTQLVTILDEIQKSEVWAAANLQETGQLLAKELEIDLDVIQGIVNTTDFHVYYLDDRTINDQQNIADVFTTLGLIPKTLVVKDAVWLGDGKTLQVEPTITATAAATQAQ